MGRHRQLREFQGGNLFIQHPKNDAVVKWWWVTWGRCGYGESNWGKLKTARLCIQTSYEPYLRKGQQGNQRPTHSFQKILASPPSNLWGLPTADPQNHSETHHHPLCSVPERETKQNHHDYNKFCHIKITFLYKSLIRSFVLLPRQKVINSNIICKQQ